jgi:hypothetical protein
MSSELPRRRRRGIGCLPGLLLILVVGPLLIAGIDLIFAPWIYSVGGRTRLLPIWAAVGSADTPVGKYQIHIWFSPTPSGSHVLPSASVKGSAYVCTPSGKHYSLNLTGGASGRIWRDMDGHAFSLYAYNRPFFAGVTGDHRPRLNFSGAWVQNSLKMDDGGTLAQAFLASGELSPAKGGVPLKEKAVPITFEETSWWIPSSCPR